MSLYREIRETLLFLTCPGSPPMLHKKENFKISEQYRAPKQFELINQ